MTAKIEPGARAPAFSLPRDGGAKIATKDLAGRPYVLYFYPKDATGGCTKEALAFTALAKDFAAAGVTVIGCSRDSVASHDKFKAKQNLDLVLAADVEGKLSDAYGVWVEKTLYGKKYMGMERSTFLVDAAGRINAVWRKVKVDGHAEHVLEAARKLG